MFEDKISQRVVPLPAFIFPALELVYYFGYKIFMIFDTQFVRKLYLYYIHPIRHYYSENMIFMIIIMFVLYSACAGGKARIPLFIRFHVCQAILINILITCIGQFYMLTPLVIRESFFIANVIIMPTVIILMGTIIHAFISVLCGRYTRYPLISDAARLTLQWNDYGI